MKKGVIIFLALVVTFCFGQITRGPYLLPTENLEERIGIAWRAENSSGGVVYYRVKGEESWLSLSVSGGEVCPYTGEMKYYVELGELMPGQEYEYYLKVAGETTSVYTFKTSSRAEDFSFKLLIFSDPHYPDGASRVKDFLPHFLSFAPDLVIIEGDLTNLIDTGNDVTVFDSFFEGLKALLAEAIFLPVCGNHDCLRYGDIEKYCSQFHLPSNGPARGRDGYPWSKGVAYSVDYGKAHFIIGGIAKGGSKRMVPFFEWLKAHCLSLQNEEEIEWIFYNQHHPDGDKRLITPLQSLSSEKRKVFLLSGHKHTYRRTYPLISHDGKFFPDSFTVKSKEKKSYSSQTGGIVCFSIPSPYFASSSEKIEGRDVCQKQFRGFVKVLVDNQGKLQWETVSLEGIEDSFSFVLSSTKIENWEEKSLNKIPYPNPFNLECYLPLNVKGKCKIYNILGQLVREIEHLRTYPLDGSRVYWNGKDSGELEVPSGVYFYKVAAEDVWRMVVLK
jgi:3',5'-cyclic AMP phosphodiesterase CpdA